ncbi:MAG: DNA gyrase subunit A, partial [Thermoplasmata archaeon]|nr:DNA gyrase subunit A [Thermoplasmata archaeon]
MKESYLDYAMSVIVGRALPDVRDGLKPVHRRILYAMNEMGLAHNKAYKKSARVVGEVLGKYHPHGDTAVYDALVRMAQDFSLRYPLVDGQGNFGSVDGDSPAAMRYTECRMSRMGEEMLRDIGKDTVEFADNFDASLKEPLVLPSGFPNLLVNGSSGIAVGMATNIPPHNLNEILDAASALIDDPSLSSLDLMEYVKGPDFPTGGIVYGINGVAAAYTTGRGPIRVRARMEVEKDRKTKRERLVVTEIPYMVNKARLLESIAELVKDKKIEGISDIRDESDRRGMRVVIELKKDAIPEVVMNQLYAHTQMQTTFGVINLALVDGRPRVLTLKEMIWEYVKHRREVVVRRTEYDLRKAEERAHILEGLLTALDNLDEVIAIIRRSEDGQTAKQALMNRFILTEIQAGAILDMRLQKLTGMERQTLKDEHAEVMEKIKEFKTILSSEENIMAVVKEEFAALKEKYGDERRTTIEENAEEIEIEDLIPVEDVVVTLTHSGYIKRMPISTYRAQRRGGVGLLGMETKEEDSILHAFVTSTHDYVLFFTNLGKVYWLKGYRIPLGGRRSRGKAVVNLLPRLEEGEKIQTAIPVKEFSETMHLVFATRRGKIKKTPLSAYSHPRITGIKAVRLMDGDELVDVALTDGKKEIVLATRNGLAARFPEGEVRPMGRVAAG